MTLILRGPIVSEQRRALGFGRAPALEPGVDVRADRGEPSVVRIEAEISPERIESWLALQDVEMRGACAELFADDIAEVREQARAEGLAAGFQEGREQALREMQEVLTLLRQINAAAEQAFQREQDELAAHCVDMVGAVFARLAGAVLSTPQATLAIVAEVLKKVREGRELTVRVNTSDLPLLQAQENALSAALPGRRITLAADSRVEAGGCIVETSLGSLDGRLEVQLRGLCETLKASKAARAEFA